MELSTQKEFFYLKEENVKFKDGRKVRECKVKDDTAIIKSTNQKMFGDIIGEVKEKPAYKISYLRVAKCDYEVYLKTFNSNNSTWA